jgi:multisubunit Na+/H+ antiporter MnhB subunit
VLLQVATIIALIVLALLLRRHGAPGFAFTVAAAAMFAIGLLIWWVLVYPVNFQLAKWVNGPVPDNWAEWRSLWESGQAANGLAQLMGFATLIASVLVRRAQQRS